MSKDYPTIAETEAYDRGFADAEDYWRPKELERIVELLEKQRSQCEKAGLFANDPMIRGELQTLFIGIEAALDAIRDGE